MELESRDRANWDALLNRFHGESFFRRRPVLSQRGPQVAILHVSRLRRGVAVVLLLVLGTLLLLLPVILRPEAQAAPRNVLPWDAWRLRIARFGGPIGGIVLMAVGFDALLRRNQVRFDRLRGVARFRWGLAPFARQVELPLGALRLLLYQRGGEEIGFTALGVECQGDDRRLRIASTKWRSQMLPIYEGLAEAFGQSAVDSTQHATPDARNPTSVARTPIRTTVDRGRSRRLTVDSDMVVLRGTKLLSIFIVAVAIAIVVFVVSMDIEFGLMPIWTYVVVGGLAAFIGVLGLCVWPRTVVLKRHDWLRLPQCAADGPWPGQLHASDVAAVQLCSVRGEGEHIPVVNFKLSYYAACQVNLVSKGPATCRVNLLCDTDTLRAKEAASAIAALLDVPVLDHRVPVPLRTGELD
jgi:hypothetical protein